MIAESGIERKIAEHSLVRNPAKPIGRSTDRSLKNWSRDLAACEAPAVEGTVPTSQRRQPQNLNKRDVQCDNET